MNHASLFSGIGGFDLAAQWMQWNNVFHCEINPFCQRILAHHFPGSWGHSDITKTDFTIYNGTIDVLTGGFPCQPFSGSGNQLGTEDPRHLWGQMFRAVKEIRPRYIVGENVRNFVTWNKGMALDQMLTDLEAEGYEVQPFIIPACSLNAPHKRERTWIIAYSNSAPTRDKVQAGRDVSTGVFYSDSNGQRLRRKSNGIGVSGQSSETGSKNDRWENFPTESPICTGGNGIPSGLDGITFSKWRRESIKAAGNAIVPQIAYQLFQTINALEYEKQYCYQQVINHAGRNI